MSRSLWKTLLALAALVALLGLSACGGDDDEGGDTGGTPAQTEEGGGDANVTEQLFAGTAHGEHQGPGEGKKGGKLTVLSGGDVDYMDPRQDVLHVRDRDHERDPPRAVRVPARTSRPSRCRTSPTSDARDLRGRQDRHREDQEGHHVLQAGQPRGESKDVKYAIERAFTANVPQRLRPRLPGRPRGRSEGAGRLQGDPGHRDAGRSHDRLQAHQGHGRGARRRARRCRSRSRCRRSSREKYDKRDPVDVRRGGTRSTPARTWSSPMRRARRPATWPARRIHLVRNPDYAPVDDFRPAYLDEIEFQAGNEDTAVATRRILSGENLAGGDIEPPSRPAQDAAREQQDRALGGAGRWLAHDLDGHEPPAVRRHQRPQGRHRRLQPRRGAASSAAARRSGRSPSTTSRRAWPASRSPAASTAGPPRWTGWPSRRATARWSAEYFKKAGMASGKYEGDEEVLIVGDNAEPDKSIAQITEQQLNEMGFKTKLRLVTRDTMFTKFCNVPDSEVNVCPSVGWSKDFSDPQTMLDPTFNGENIMPTQNSNWPELDVPEVNKAIDDAKLVTDPAERAQAWADVEQADHGAGAGDPVHVGLPVDRRSRRTCAACRTATAPPGTGPSPRSGRSRPEPSSRPARRLARRAGPAPPSSDHGPLHRPPPRSGWCCC